MPFLGRRQPAKYLLEWTGDPSANARLRNWTTKVWLNPGCMSDEQERKEVFAWFGAASYYAQCVEVELRIARLFLARKDEPWLKEQEWQRVESERLTMGRLLGLLERGIELRSAERETLQACLDKRNWLSHAYWEQRSHLLASSDGRSCHAVEARAELCEAFQKGDEVARSLSARIRAKVGVSEDMVRTLQNEYIQRLKNGESRELILQDLENRMKSLSAQISRTVE